MRQHSFIIKGEITMIQLRLRNYNKHDLETLLSCFERAEENLLKSCDGKCLICDERKVCNDLAEAYHFIVSKLDKQEQ